MEDDRLISDVAQADIVIRQSDNGIVAAIPQFGLFAEGRTVNEALDSLEIKKQSLQADFATFGNLKSYRTNNEIASIRWREIYQFAIKSCIVLSIVIVAIFFLSYKIDQSLTSAVYRFQIVAQTNIDRLTVGSGNAFWSKVSRELDRAANSNIPEDTKQKLLADIRTIVEKWRPFVAAASGIFATAPTHDLQSQTLDKK